MVFFTCNACGESVKKVQVEKHVAVCRNCECLSCMDCGKDFWGDDYNHHVKCISEEQKYGGKGYEGKTHKGDVILLQARIQKINELIKRPNVSPKVRELLEQISGFDNVPRKRAKFQNWKKNSLKVHNESVLEQVWNIFSEASSNEAVSKGQAQQPLAQVASPPRAELSAQVLAVGTNDPTEKQAEVKKNKRERKEERQKNRKKEKKELKLENPQENSKGQKPKKRKTGQEAGEEAPASAGKSSQSKAGEAKGAADRAEEGEAEESRKARPGKRKQKHSEDDIESKKKKDHESPAKGKFNWKGTIKALNGGGGGESVQCMS
uniref:Cell growth-regulating nucleolar protein n=1 Tax=Canis lupus dingo TaxID=286419 RepID=A0A8C0KDJ1_CANLU